MNEIVVGTYEGFILGYTVQLKDEIKSIKQTFATHSHTSSVRCISTAERYLATGGTDDKVVVIDLKTRKDHTVLVNHSGTINTAAFTHNGTHLLTGSDDGSIIITRTGNWQTEKIWNKAHEGHPVTAIAVHPSNKLALSVGGDKTLRTWNLVKGRKAFTINLNSKNVTMPSEIKFSPSGDRFSCISDKLVDIWTISQAGIEKRISCNSKPTTVQWVTDEKLIVGLDNGNIIILTVSNTQANTYKAHKQRVKCLHYENGILYSASSSGEFKVWSLSESKLTEICSHNASCRITCLTLNRLGHLIKKEESDDDGKEAEKIDTTQDSEGSHVPEEITQTSAQLPVKRKPGAYVTISHGDDEETPKISPPPKKKFKKWNKNKKFKNKVSK